MHGQFGSEDHMDVKALHRLFVEFATAASDDLGGPPVARELSSVLAISEEEFGTFWARISRQEELRRRWIDRLTRGYASVKADLKAVFEADGGRHPSSVCSQLDREAA